MEEAKKSTTKNICQGCTIKNKDKDTCDRCCSAQGAKLKKGEVKESSYWLPKGPKGECGVCGHKECKCSDKAKNDRKWWDYLHKRLQGVPKGKLPMPNAKQGQVKTAGESVDIKDMITMVEDGVPATEVLETAGIKSLYRKAGMKPPVGKGIHQKRFHVLVTKIGAKQKGKEHKVNPYAVAMSVLGAKKAVKKSHRRSK